ncbi:hypothetical protein L1987_30235 [Smallanthus sonchifolius]|uniref:Uncharacterized protein n=1 Tax=Smallanthus sonchifolius TaxID=185202 RepID=A0ACB9I291_9ASTR|nr:hypothetical protein L1987_30235 [Smallanthus sonchifolius]
MHVVLRGFHIVNLARGWEEGFTTIWWSKTEDSNSMGIVKKIPTAQLPNSGHARIEAFKLKNMAVLSRFRSSYDFGGVNLNFHV